MGVCLNCLNKHSGQCLLNNSQTCSLTQNGGALHQCMLCKEQQKSVGCTSWTLGDGSEKLCDLIDQAEFLSDIGVQENYQGSQTVGAIGEKSKVRDIATLVAEFREKLKGAKGPPTLKSVSIVTATGNDVVSEGKHEPQLCINMLSSKVVNEKITPNAMLDKKNCQYNKNHTTETTLTVAIVT